VGSEPTTPVFEQAKTVLASCRMVTVININYTVIKTNNFKAWLTSGSSFIKETADDK
jgi:hypothetical protein